MVQCFAAYTGGANRGTDLEHIRAESYIKYNGIAALGILNNDWRLYKGGDNSHLQQQQKKK